MDIIVVFYMKYVWICDSMKAVVLYIGILANSIILILNRKNTYRLCIVFNLCRNSLQGLENSIGDIKRMRESIFNRSKVVESEIHSVMQKHRAALDQRERDLVRRVEQIRLVRIN